MARPPYMVESYETVKCWEELCRLLRLEQKKHTLDDIQQLVDCHNGLQDLIHVIAEADGSPAPTMDLIKSNLGLAQDFVEELGKATELYNIAVCRIIGPAMYTTLPREVRDMVYEYLTPHQLDIDLKPCCPCADCELLHVFGEDTEYRLYFDPRPRTQDDEVCPEYYWRDDIIGREAAYELMEAWYRNSIFNMRAEWIEDDWPTRWLNTLLNHDRFAAGLRPRKLIAKFAFDVLVRGAEEAEFDTLWQKNVFKAMESLFLLKEGTRIQISVKFQFCRDEVAGLRLFLDRIRPAFLRLRNLGYRCTIKIIKRRLKLLHEIVEEWVQELETEVKGNDNAGLIGV